MHYRQAMKSLSAELPNWFIFYAPYIKNYNNPLPSTVYRGGIENYFIGK